jgi:hypothetical protein
MQAGSLRYNAGRMPALQRPPPRGDPGRFSCGVAILAALVRASCRQPPWLSLWLHPARNMLNPRCRFVPPPLLSRRRRRRSRKPKAKPDPRPDSATTACQSVIEEIPRLGRWAASLRMTQSTFRARSPSGATSRGISSSNNLFAIGESRVRPQGPILSKIKEGAPVGTPCLALRWICAYSMSKLCSSTGMLVSSQTLSM